VKTRERAEDKKLGRRSKREIRELLLVQLNTGSVSEPGTAELNAEVTEEVTISNLNKDKINGI